MRWKVAQSRLNWKIPLFAGFQIVSSAPSRKQQRLWIPSSSIKGSNNISIPVVKSNKVCNYVGQVASGSQIFLSFNPIKWFFLNGAKGQAKIRCFYHHQLNAKYDHEISSYYWECFSIPRGLVGHVPPKRIESFIYLTRPMQLVRFLTNSKVPTMSQQAIFWLTIVGGAGANTA